LKPRPKVFGYFVEDDLPIYNEKYRKKAYLMQKFI